MTEISHRFIDTNGIRLHVAEAGTGPLVVLCHEFPESWYSWRHQLPALAEAGFHAVAPDMRGYGRSSTYDRHEDFERRKSLDVGTACCKRRSGCRRGEKSVPSRQAPADGRRSNRPEAIALPPGQPAS